MKKYKYDNGYITVSKAEALEAYINGMPIMIGYHNKDDGAYWTPRQFANVLTGDRKKDFDVIIKCVKSYIPHKKIKYAISPEESGEEEYIPLF